MGLKLLIIIIQNMTALPVCSENLETIKATLPSDLLMNAFKLEACKDKKLSEIGLFLKSLIHKEDAGKAAAD